ncbi:hypothetical protein KMZ29_05085 [Bradyrhizobium sediminis]|uniref:Uncharacterized protein n=1 Tax=Bradyrhizobium sediminis TaxID=2840469 RepID=A0A975NFF0_9BRAD|nr:hypothetical protein [Bradyrhizobium sediminis]QWG14077.1 hypothetical protein KMZ29_05085 [Bradyrhizobium sediminis]
MALKRPKLFPFFAVHRLNTPSGVGYIDGIIGNPAGSPTATLPGIFARGLGERKTFVEQASKACYTIV